MNASAGSQKARRNLQRKVFERIKESKCGTSRKFIRIKQALETQVNYLHVDLWFL